MSASVLLDHTTTLAASVHALGPGWMDPQAVLNTFLDKYGTFAIIGVACIVFIETGLLFPILPGDSLLFMAGAFVAQGTLHLPLLAVSLILFCAAVAGNSTGYLIGRTVGGKLFDRPDSKIFKREYIDKTNAYFDKYGGRTITIAQFVPIVRTYAPVAAGVGKMEFRHFITYNAIGALLWAVGISLLGYLLGNVPFVKNHIEALVLLLVAFSVVPMVFEVVREKMRRQRSAAAEREPVNH